MGSGNLQRERRERPEKEGRVVPAQCIGIYGAGRGRVNHGPSSSSPLAEAPLTVTAIQS